MGMTDVKFLIDRGYGSQANYSELLEAGIDFTSPVNLNMTWMKKEFTSPVGEFANIAEAFRTAPILIIDDTPSELALTFEDGIISMRKECTVQFSQCTREHTLWLYFYKNLENAANEEAKYLEKLKDLLSRINKGAMLYKDLTTEELTTLSKSYNISETADGFVRISPNKEKMEYQSSTYGVHVIMSTDKKNLVK